ARHTGTLTDAFDAAVSGGAADGSPRATAAGPPAGDLIEALHAVAPHLSAVQRFSVVEGLRTLSPGAPDGRPRRGTAASALTLLRQLGAVLVRADLDRALDAAHLGADPWSAAPAVLREAFGVRADAAVVEESASWRAELTEAVRTPDALARFRGRDVAAGARPRRATGAEGARRAPAATESRELLPALVEAYPKAAPDVRGRLVDWMTELQPIDAPAWIIAGTRAADTASGASSRPMRADDLDQPRSAAQRTRLLAMLDAERPERRTAAARALLDWPEPGVSRAVLRAYLRGRVDVLPATATLDLLAHPDDPAGAHPDAHPGEGDGRHPAVVELTSRGVLPERALCWAARLPEDDLPLLVPLIVGWWEHGSPAVHEAARTTLHGVPADVLAHVLAPRVEAGDLGLLDLLTGVRLLRTPALTRAERRLRTEGRDALADALVLVDGPLRAPGAEHEDAAALDALRTPFRNPAGAPAGRPSLPELLDLARTGTPEQTRQALARLVEEHAPAPGAGPAPELHPLVEELLRHPRAGVRLHAHRTSRALFDRDTHARLTALLLSDPLPDVVRMAARTLGRAAWEPALPDLVRLLDHAKPVVRSAARDALARFGGTAVPVLRRAAAHARPDRRPLYTDVLAEISGAGG
ncbi:HEAT repeat domain-containing protein, partial [Streptomyces sp. rh34]|uniref:HEAT repeat domain-containing protein n=1 Tax=Streptomyces sp. rh34 TaxID=2034272 RepID=UPI00117D6E5C